MSSAILQSVVVAVEGLQHPLVVGVTAVHGGFEVAETAEEVIPHPQGDGDRGCHVVA